MKPKGVLVCRPTFFDVIDRKNLFMDPGNKIDRTRALQQWTAAVEAFRKSGLFVSEVAPLQGCEDMVFTANPALTGLDRQGKRRAVASRMRHASRKLEVAPQIERLRSLGYEVVDLPEDVTFEGGGDAVWHLSGKTLFLGIGSRSDVAAAANLERTYSVEVVPLRLSTERFYHLDTALCVLDEDTAIAYPGALDNISYAEITRRFSTIIEVQEAEANRMACNAARAGDNVVVIHCDATATIAALRDHGYDVAAIDTSELMKSGGSVSCMKQYLF
ncbi:MAG: arginine deiminase family protein [Candidatus Eremiobacteraeota bacterium]|nr:arginine deiminase family protein [Candidatus Eremiobacteraeota bacterium]